MSITIQEFDEGNFDRRGKKIIKTHPVIVFLEENKRAYKIKEICKATGIKENTLRHFLRDQVKKGIIIHKVPFFTLKR